MTSQREEIDGLRTLQAAAREDKLRLQEQLYQADLEVNRARQSVAAMEEELGGVRKELDVAHNAHRVTQVTAIPRHGEAWRHSQAQPGHHHAAPIATCFTPVYSPQPNLGQHSHLHFDALLFEVALNKALRANRRAEGGSH